METNKIELLKSRVNQLENEVNGKDLELRLLEMGLIDVNKPFAVIGETQGIFIQMLEEIVSHVKLKGKSDKATVSQNRILKLMELNDQMSNIVQHNNSLKIFAKEIHTHYQVLRCQNLELKTELNKVKNAESF